MSVDLFVVKLIVNEETVFVLFAWINVLTLSFKVAIIELCITFKAYCSMLPWNYLSMIKCQVFFFLQRNSKGQWRYYCHVFIYILTVDRNFEVCIFLLVIIHCGCIDDLVVEIMMSCHCSWHNLMIDFESRYKCTKNNMKKGRFRISSLKVFIGCESKNVYKIKEWQPLVTLLWLILNL